MSELPYTVPLREHVESIFVEKAQATVVAEQEREKAAQARRLDLDHRIQEVDRHLRQHIATQIDQVTADRKAATALLENMIDAVRREMTLIHNASEKAISKAEEQNIAWRAQANEWRGQSADRERSQEEQLAKLAATFLPRESFDKVVEGWDAWRADLNQRVNTAAGAALQERRSNATMQPWMLWAAGAALTVFLTIVVVVANVLSAMPQ